MKAWRVDYGTPHPVEVEVPQLEPWHPDLKDSNGQYVYLNTHFATKAEAWAKLLVEVDAAVQLDERAHARAKRELERLDVELANSRRIALEAHAAAPSPERQKKETGRDT